MSQAENHQELLSELARLAGIHLEYFDIWGQAHVLSPETRDGLLQAMGLPVQDPGAVRAAVEERVGRPYQQPLPPVVVLVQGRPGAGIPISLPADQAPEGMSYSIEDEEPRQGADRGGLHTGDLLPEALHALERREVGGRAYARYRLELPMELPWGYHRFSLLDAGGGLLAETRLIVAPPSCYMPPCVQGEGRVWGLAAQLYSVRSRRNWGAGDYTDLLELVTRCPQLGAALVGLNPLHALFPHNPAHESPYCPSSRLFFNTFYLDVAAVPEAEECREVRQGLQDPALLGRLEALRGGELVDYPAVAALKRPLLERLWEHFCEAHLDRGTPRGQAFREYVARQGEALRLHALCEALQEHFFALDPGAWGWPCWPEAYRRPATPEVLAFEAAHPRRVGFFMYLQFCAEEQLAAAAGRAAELGLGLGLYMDLSVSVDRAGADVWAHQELFAMEASVGAPPDALGPRGQNWGLPPLVPERLTGSGYRPFIDMLRQNMRHAGALRLDHAMGLMRLFWIPAGRSAAEGAYVSYPLEDLLGILALESHRNRCLVIGEDLGTVPDEVRAALGRAGVLSYRLLIFEHRADGELTRPAEYPRQALVTVTTHDLPTLGAFWEGYDIALRDVKDLYPSPELRRQHVQEREEDRWRLLHALAELDLLPASVPADPAATPALTADLARAVQVYLASAPSQVMVVQLEDLLLQVSQANLPSTTTEHPNWKQKLRTPLEELLADQEVQATAAAISRRTVQRSS